MPLKWIVNANKSPYGGDAVSCHGGDGLRSIGDGRTPFDRGHRRRHRAAAKATAPDQIKIEKVPSALIEELGDAVMGVLIGNSATHDRMDRMLGGDGSSRLTAFHADLGEQYLRNGGLDGVRMGGPWGMGRFGMMYGWGRLGNQTPDQYKTIEGNSVSSIIRRP